MLKTEIHPTLPKITVTGNVDVQTLIKRLAKSGKSVELWPVVPEKEEKQSESKIKEKPTETSCKEKDRAKDTNGDNQEIDLNKSKVKFKEHEESEIRSKNADEATKTTPDQAAKSSSYQTVVAAIPQVNCLVNPGTMPAYVQGYYPLPQLQPTIPMPYYAMNMNAYSATPPICIHDHCHCRLPAINPPPVQPENATGFADYFNDDNTVGCSVM